MLWQAIYIHASSYLQQLTRTQMYLSTTWPQAALHRYNPSKKPPVH